MSKRFIDTNIFRKDFTRGLQAPYKLLWFYIISECNHAGIWDVELDVAQLRIGQDAPVTEQGAMDAFKGKIEVLDDGRKWFIPAFIDFQYGTLNPQNRAHKSVIDILDSLKKKPLPSPLQGCKDKDKDKDKDTDKDPVQFKASVDQWNALAEKSGLNKIRDIKGERRVMFTARLKDNPDFWEVVTRELDCLDAFAKGDNERKWVMDFDWILVAGNFSKLAEGKYRAKNRTPVKPQESNYWRPT